MGHQLCEAAKRAAAAVRETRLWHMLMNVAEFGARDDGGVERHALSPEDHAARAYLIDKARAQGYEVSVDAAANLWLRRPGKNPKAEPVIAGSHLDTQPAGGRFDGALGVLAAFETLMALDDAGVSTLRPIDVVAWTNEEGGRFDRSCTGSMVWSGEVELSQISDDVDADGVGLGDALADTLAATPGLPHRPTTWPAHAALELHIEQGPILEASRVPIAAVTSIQGARWFNVEVFGQASHAGTTPLTARRDALQAAHRAVSALNALMHDVNDVVRFTVGRLIVEPNSPNTVPSRVVFTIDFRHPAEAVPPCTHRLTLTQDMAPVVFPKAIIETIEASAEALGLASRRLASGAIHDALYLSRACPTGMIFVPCRDGLSHHPEEWTSPEHCTAGARVLTATVAQLANV